MKQLSTVGRMKQDWGFRAAGRGRLAPLAKFENTVGWSWQGFCVPGSLLGAGLGARQSFENQVKMPPYSIITSISAGSNQAAGFRFFIKESKSGRAVFNDFLNHRLVGSPNNGLYQQFVLPGPYTVPDDGVLTVQISNLADAVADCQVLICVAVPEMAVIQRAAQV